MKVPSELIGKTMRADGRARRELRIFAGFCFLMGTCLLVAGWMSGTSVYILAITGAITLVLTSYLLYESYLLETLFLTLDEISLVYKIGKQGCRLNWDELKTVDARWLWLPARPLKPLVLPSWRLKLNYWIVRFLGMPREKALDYVEQISCKNPYAEQFSCKDPRRIIFILEGRKGLRVKIIPGKFEYPYNHLLKAWLWSIWQEKNNFSPS